MKKDAVQLQNTGYEMKTAEYELPVAAGTFR